jgi:hypothetical protein
LYYGSCSEFVKTEMIYAWFIYVDEKHCCILWSIDGAGKAEDGAVFGIWGADCPHEGLTFRVAPKRKISVRNEPRCLQNRTKEGLKNFLQRNGVYIGSKKEAERFKHTYKPSLKPR